MLHTHEVVGSNPSRPTSKIKGFGSLTPKPLFLLHTFIHTVIRIIALTASLVPALRNYDHGTSELKCIRGNTLGILLLHKFPNLHPPFTRHAHKVNPAGKTAYVKLGFGFGELAGEELLIAEVLDRKVAPDG